MRLARERAGHYSGVLADMTRDRVYLHQNINPRVGEELANRELVTTHIESIDQFRSAVADPLCKCIVYRSNRPLSPEARREFGVLKDELIPQAAKRGVGVVLVVDNDDEQKIGRAWIAEQLKVSAADLGSVSPGIFRPRVLDNADINPAILAHEIFRYDPMRPLSDTIILPDDAPVDEREPGQETSAEAFARCPDDETIIQRAFGDYPRVRVRLLLSKQAGLKSRHVFQVWPEVNDGPEVIPFIIKSGSAEDVAIELGNTQQACDDSTPFPYFAPLALDRSVTIDPRSALVSHFVERATLLEDYIRYNSPALAIASIFDGPLRAWRSSVQDADLNVGKFARSQGLVGTAVQYAKAYADSGEGCSTPDQMMAKVDSLGDRTVKFCRSHGDLHLKNVFVRENSVEIVLVDFNRAGLAPASKDPAELEVSLAFSPLAKIEEPLAEDLVMRLYDRPLLSQVNLSRRSHPRALAVEQVRRQTIGLVSEDEYREMVAAHCLWYAARRKDALAYRVADRLL